MNRRVVLTLQFYYGYTMCYLDECLIASDKFSIG